MSSGILCIVVERPGKQKIKLTPLNRKIFIFYRYLFIMPRIQEGCDYI
jgi:hypothetical protein